ncbi:MAG: hypothetical protein L0219_03695, partial [Phycisphaerales bacterium]|nr:hypothetical protein [Phycisphaerales bacterium]
MNFLRDRIVVGGIIVCVLVFGGVGDAAGQEQEYENFAAARFDNPTVIDNEWFPLVPGTQYVWDGSAVDEEGDIEPLSVQFTVTDLTKEIGGVRTVVCLDRDIADRELAEAEIAFFAQDNDGNVWLLGEYPEEYDDGQLDAAPCWMHGIGGARAGLAMRA